MLSKIRDAINKANNQGFAEVVEEGTIELAIANEENKVLLEKWANEKDLKIGELIGPPINVNEILRLAGKIEKEQKQLCKDSLNILVIKDPMFFLHIRDVRSAINLLEEYVYKFEHVAFCCVISNYLGVEEHKQIVHGPHFYIRKKYENGVMEEILVLINRFIKEKTITPNSYSKIITALTS